MRTIEEWYDTLVELTKNTDYEVLIKTKICSPVVAIVSERRHSEKRKT